MDKILQKLEEYLLYAIVFLFPIAVASVSPNPFVPVKLAILTFGIGLVLLVKSGRVLSTGQFDFSGAKFDLPVLALLVIYLASALLRTPNKMEAFLLPGTATGVVAAALLYFLINQLSEQSKATLTKFFFASAVAFATISLSSVSGLLAKIPQLPSYMKTLTFNPEGGFLPAVIFLGTQIPIGISLFFTSQKIASRALLGLANLVIILAVGISVYNLLPGMPFSPRFPSFTTSWAIAIDSLKEQAFLGTGAGNYLTAFSRYRPLSFNTTDLWAIKFATAKDFYLTHLTETGLLGAAAVVLLLVAIYKNLKSVLSGKGAAKFFVENSPFVSLLVLLSLLIFFPITPTLTVTIFILLSLSAKTRKTTLMLSSQTASDVDSEPLSAKTAFRVPAFLVTLPVIVGVFAFAYYGSRALYAEYQFKKGLDALVRNEAVPTYDLMREAISLNPYVDRYHATYSQVNLALVNAIAAKAEITDSDRSNIAQLIQQAIREAKATVALNPLDSGSWELLGRTYQAIIPLTSGAEAFAVDSIRQAIILDPINPNLRVTLGGLYYARADFDNAIRVFELAVATKPDLANSHYNLAFALREKGEIERAINQMSVVLSLVDKDSQDYQLAKATLEDLEKKRPPAKEATQNLTPPQEAEAPALEPPLELPSGSQPPETAITTPTPTP